MITQKELIELLNQSQTYKAKIKKLEEEHAKVWEKIKLFGKQIPEGETKELPGGWKIRPMFKPKYRATKGIEYLPVEVLDISSPKVTAYRKLNNGELPKGIACESKFSHPVIYPPKKSKK